MTNNTYLSHHGIKGMKWGERRFQYQDGSLTPAGRDRYGVGEERKKTPFARIVLSKKKNTVDTDADNLSGKQNKLIDKIRGPRHRGNGQEEPKKPLTDEERASLIRSGDVNKILSRADELSPQEMSTAIQRARDLDSLRQFSDREEQRNQTVVDKAKSLKDKMDEASRQKILRSGSAKEILENADKFSNNELNDALTRAKYTAALKEQAKLESRSKIKSIMNVATNALDLLDKAQNIKNRWNNLFGDDDDSSFLNLSPEDALSQMGSWNKDKLKAYKERTDLFNTIGNNLKGVIERNKGKNKYDFSNATPDELLDRYNKSGDEDERKAIANTLDTMKKNQANVNALNGMPSGNQKKQQDQQNGQNGNQKKQDKQGKTETKSETKPKHEDDGKPIPKPETTEKQPNRSEMLDRVVAETNRKYNERLAQDQESYSHIADYWNKRNSKEYFEKERNSKEDRKNRNEQLKSYASFLEDANNAKLVERAQEQKMREDHANEYYQKQEDIKETNRLINNAIKALDKALKS